MKISKTTIVEFLSKITLTVAGFVSTLLFARYLGSGVLGQYFLLIGVLSWLEFAGQLGVTKAIQKRVSENELPAAYLGAGLLIQATIASLLAGAILLAGDYVNQYLGASVVEFVVLLVLVRLGYGYVTAGLRGQHRVATAASLETAATVLQAGLQVLMAIGLGLGFLGLIYGYFSAFFIIIVVGLLLISNRHRPALPSREHVKKLLSFAQYSWLGVLKTRTSAWMDIIVLGIFIPQSLVGIYGASWRVAVVISLASQSLWQTLFPAMSELNANKNTPEIRSLFEKGLMYGGIIAIPGAVGLILLGSEILRIYGSEFTQGGHILAILAFSALFASYEGQFRAALDATNRPDLTFISNLLFLVINVTGNIVLVWQFGWIGAAVATSGSMLVSLVYSYTLVDRTLGVTIPIGEIGKQVTASAVMAVVVVIVKEFTKTQPYYFVIMTITIGVLVYSLTLLVLSLEVRTKAMEFADLLVN